LLAAGLGSRLAPLTDSVPKCLVPILGKPLLGFWLDLLGEAGAAPIIVNTHHHADAVREFTASSPWRDRILTTHEERLLGTGGTLLAHRERLAGGPFFVAHADNLSRFRVADFFSAHRFRPTGCLMTMMLFRTPTPESCGIVELDACGVVAAFHEKASNPPGNLANAAIYVMEPETLDILAGTGGADISLDLIPRCLGRINTWLNQDYHRDIGTPESYAAALRELGDSVAATLE
jgi:mannose-1-phosphate guanylyltransferase